MARTRSAAAAASGHPPPAPRSTKHQKDEAPSHWREVHDPHTGRLLRCRPHGSPAGSWPHTPYWHCVFHDPYERINFWSHATPAAIFLAIAVASLAGLTDNDTAGAAVLALFSGCAFVTHCISALTHVWPDNHSVEKCDHIGIVFTIVGTPMSAMMAKEHGHMPPLLMCIALQLLVAAALRPVPRVAGFLSGGAVLVWFYGGQLVDGVFLVELILYVSGALFFLRNNGHARGVGLSDHHFLHYFVTVASFMHIYYLQSCLH